MALRDLTTEQMLLISGKWLEKGGEKSILEGVPTVKPLVPELGAAHGTLRTAGVKDTALTEELKGIQEAQLDRDRRHDRKARGSIKVVEAYADLVDDPDEAARYRDLAARLSPDGLKFITSSYSDEAGNVTRVRGRLTADDKALLKKVPSPNGTLLQSVEQWFKAGEELGELEHKKAKLRSAIDAQPTEAPKPNELQARNQWIRIVNGVLHMLELSNLKPEQRRPIVSLLEAELAKVERRPALSETSPPEGAAPAPETPPTA